MNSSFNLYTQEGQDFVAITDVKALSAAHSQATIYCREDVVCRAIDLWVTKKGKGCPEINY